MGEEEGWKRAGWPAQYGEVVPLPLSTMEWINGMEERSGEWDGARARDSQFVPFISSGSVRLEAAGSTIDGPNAMQDHEVSGLGHRETPM